MIICTTCGSTVTIDSGSKACDSCGLHPFECTCDIQGCPMCGGTQYPVGNNGMRWACAGCERPTEGCTCEED